MDDDDVSLPDRFLVQVDFLDKHPEYAVIGTKRRCFDSDGYWGDFSFSGDVSVEDLYSKATLQTW